MALLNAHCNGYCYFKDSSMVFTDTFCFNFTVALPNKNNNNNYNNNNEMENSGIDLGISESAENYLNNCLRFQQLSE